MMLHEFSHGDEIFYLHQHRWRCMVVVKSNRLGLKIKSGQQEIALKPDDLKRVRSEGRLVPANDYYKALSARDFARQVQDLTCLTEENIQEGTRRLNLVWEVEKRREEGAKSDRKAILSLPGKPPLSSMKRWLSLARQARKVGMPEHLALTPAHRMKGNRTRRIDQTLLSSIQAHFGNRQPQESIRALYHRVPNDLKGISYSTFKREFYASVSPYEHVVADSGRSRANDNFHVSRHLPDPRCCLDEVEIDEDLLPIFVKVPGTKSTVIRPWFTVLLDRKSRMVVGCHLTIEAPSIASTRAALCHMLGPKHVRTDEAQTEWPAHGLPSLIVSDAARHHTSDERKILATRLGIRWNVLPPAKPQLKGRVERFFNSLHKGAVGGLKGAFIKGDKASEDEAKRNATLTLQDLRNALLRWIVDTYHTRPHDGIGGGISPLQDWRSGDQAEIRRRQPTHLYRFLYTSTQRRKIGRGGIKARGSLYYSPRLASLRRNFGENYEYEILFDESVPGFILIVVPQSNEFIAAYAQPAKRGVRASLSASLPAGDITDTPELTTETLPILRTLGASLFTPFDESGTQSPAVSEEEAPEWNLEDHRSQIDDVKGRMK